MALSPPTLKLRSPSSLSKAPLHHLLAQLKQRIFLALSKLADRDTQQIALDELDKILHSISPDSVSVCLSCLYDSEIQQKSVVRRECVRRLASLASLHGDLLVPHLPKIVTSITRRLRDPDSSVRDACVDTMGILSAVMLAPSPPCGHDNGAHATNASTLATFSKPLFDALCEQNKSVQAGAATCLARVIESAKSPPLGAIARLCPRICKFMSNPNFLARAALLAVIGSLSQVGALGQQQLGALMPCVHEALGSTDWATRKAAAETLGRIASNSGPALGCFKSSTLSALEACRFDKVKPVRDSVHDATQQWKALPGAEPESVSSAAKSDGPALAFSVQSHEMQTPSPTVKEMVSECAKNPANAYTPGSTGHPSPTRLTKPSAEEPLAAVRRRVPTLANKKLNPNFFQNLKSRNADDLQIEVAVSGNFTLSTSAGQKLDLEGVNCIGVNDLPKRNKLSVTKRGQFSQVDDLCSHNCHEVSDVQRREPVDTQHSTGRQSKPFFVDEIAVLNSRKTNYLTTSLGEAGMWLDKKRDVINGASDVSGHPKSPSGSDSFAESQSANVKAKWQSIQKQLSQLERQQTSLVQMVQDCMASSQESISTLQGRLRGLESMVEDMARDLGFRSLRRANGFIQGYENNRIRPSGRIPVSENVNSGVRGMLESMYVPSEPVSEDWDDSTHCDSRGLMDNHVGHWQSNIGALYNVTSVVKDDLGTDQIATRKVWDRVPGPVRLGEGPSARSVWQASKDEATLAAIRVAGEDVSVAEVEALSTCPSRLVTIASSESMPYKTNGSGKGQHWTLWGSALEFVHAGDMESAYIQVLCSEDERMLVRLMSRTEPVLDQLSTSTGGEVLHAVGHLLQQQSYSILCLAWIQQLADMVGDSGGDCFALSQDAKKMLLLSLQDAVNMDLPEGWSGNSVDQLLQQLANAWCIDVEHFGADE